MRQSSTGPPPSSTFETACQLANELGKSYLPRDLRYKLGLEQGRLESLLVTLEGAQRDRHRAERKLRCAKHRGDIIG